MAEIRDFSKRIDLNQLDMDKKIQENKISIRSAFDDYNRMKEQIGRLEKELNYSRSELQNEIRKTNNVLEEQEHQLYLFKQEKLHVDIKREDKPTKKVELKQFVLEKIEHLEETLWQKTSDLKVGGEELGEKLKKI